MMRRCSQCKRIYETELPERPKGDRRSIQDIFPEALPYQREQLQTGICSDKCFDEYLQPEQDTDPVYDENGLWVSGGWRADG